MCTMSEKSKPILCPNMTLKSYNSVKSHAWKHWTLFEAGLFTRITLLLSIPIPNPLPHSSYHLHPWSIIDSSHVLYSMNIWITKKWIVRPLPYCSCNTISVSRSHISHMYIQCWVVEDCLDAQNLVLKVCHPILLFLKLTIVSRCLGRSPGHSEPCPKGTSLNIETNNSL